MKNQSDIKRYLKRQLPIIDAVNVESTWYALRMTPLGQYDTTMLEDFIKTLTITYVFTQELSKHNKEHYHCVLNTNLDEFELREKIRIFLRSVFLGAPKRGDANKQYNLSECIDAEVSIIYILKDGGTLYSSNFDKEKLLDMSKQSYKKFDKEEFAEQLKIIKDRIKSNPNIKLHTIMEDVVNLKALYRQPINMNYIHQMCLSFYLHNHPEDIKDYVENFLSRYT